MYLGKQEIALVVRLRISPLPKTQEIFLALLKSYAEMDTILFNHLYHTKAKNATHLSPTTQNEIINIIGYDIILANIISEAKQANYFSVLGMNFRVTIRSTYSYVFALLIVLVISEISCHL